MQVLALIVVIFSSPAILLGAGLLIVIPLLWFIMTANAAILASNRKIVMSRRSYIMYIVSSILAGLACAFALFTASSVLNFGDEGRVESYIFIIGITVAAVFIGALLFVGNRIQRQGSKQAHFSKRSG